MRKTKIVCTLGPASASVEIIEKMINAGMDVARLNFSHETHEIHKRTIEMVKSVRERLGAPLAIMQDTRGPEIRTRDFEGGKAVLEDGAEFTLTSRDILGNEKIASITCAELSLKIEKGNSILIDDGNISLEVDSVEGTEIRCAVIHGGVIKNHKSVNVPRVYLDMPYLSEQDKKDVLFGVENDVDFIAASFVRRAQDVIDLRKFVNYHGGHDIRIISKIENIEGVENFDEILKYSDGIMVARGDMGVEIDYELLPGLQKKFIKKCYLSGKMVITATQMLESMMNNPLPTRAEITDVANAVFDGTSAVMLSGESAAGKYPVRSIKVMAKIARQAEKDAFEMRSYEGHHYEMLPSDTTNAICDATCTTARDINAKAIIAVTKSGETARNMSKFRPLTPIVAATPLLKTYHQLALSWGVYPVLARNQDTTEDLFLHAIDCARLKDYVNSGDLVVITAGIPLSISGTTNMIKVQAVGHKE